MASSASNAAIITHSTNQNIKVYKSNLNKPITAYSRGSIPLSGNDIANASDNLSVRNIQYYIKSTSRSLPSCFYRSGAKYYLKYNTKTAVSYNASGYSSEVDGTELNFPKETINLVKNSKLPTSFEFKSECPESKNIEIKPNAQIKLMAKIDIYEDGYSFGTLSLNIATINNIKLQSSYEGTIISGRTSINKKTFNDIIASILESKDITLKQNSYNIAFEYLPDFESLESTAKLNYGGQDFKFSIGSGRWTSLAPYKEGLGIGKNYLRLLGDKKYIPMNNFPEHVSVDLNCNSNESKRCSKPLTDLSLISLFIKTTFATSDGLEHKISFKISDLKHLQISHKGQELYSIQGNNYLSLQNTSVKQEIIKTISKIKTF